LDPDLDASASRILGSPSITKQTRLQWKRLGRHLAVDPARFADGSAVIDPLGLLAVEPAPQARW
jgi:hypothetical protein